MVDLAFRNPQRERMHWTWLSMHFCAAHFQISPQVFVELLECMFESHVLKSKKSLPDQGKKVPLGCWVGSMYSFSISTELFLSELIGRSWITELVSFQQNFPCPLLFTAKVDFFFPLPPSYLFEILAAHYTNVFRTCISLKYLIVIQLLLILLVQKYFNSWVWQSMCNYISAE